VCRNLHRKRDSDPTPAYILERGDSLRTQAIGFSEEDSPRPIPYPQQQAREKKIEVGTGMDTGSNKNNDATDDMSIVKQVVVLTTNVWE
jgi:hypothetical protein